MTSLGWVGDTPGMGSGGDLGQGWGRGSWKELPALHEGSVPSPAGHRGVARPRRWHVPRSPCAPSDSRATPPFWGSSCCQPWF